VSHCITWNLQVAWTHKQHSVPHVELQDSARCKQKTCDVSVTKLMDDATGRNHWSRCRPRLRLQLPLPWSCIRFGSSPLRWICNDQVGFWIWDGGRHDFKTTERSGSASIASSRAGYMRRFKSVWEDPPDGGVLGLLETGVVVGVYIDHRCIVGGVEATCWVISTMWEFFCEDQVVEFWQWIVQATELCPWEEWLSPAATEMHLLAGGSLEFPEGPPSCCL